MCGIVYQHDLTGQPVNIDVMNQFDKQRLRGVQGFGLFDGQEMNMVHHSKENGILKWLDRYPSNMILFHHRFPTSTVNVKRAAHPFSTKDYFGDVQYILVHNGSIRNANELFCDHQEEGIEYQSLLDDLTFNDSEALLWDFALTMEGKQKEMKAYGAIALVCLKLVKGKIERLYFARNSNPLNMFRDKNNLSLSSEGAGEPIESHMLYNYHYKSNRLTSRKFEVNSFKPSEAYEYRGGYSADGSKFRGGSACSPSYTPGSYAARHSGHTSRRSSSVKPPGIFDCNCEEVGWENCEFHGTFSSSENERASSHDGFDYLRDETSVEVSDDDDEKRYDDWWGNKRAEAQKKGRPGDWLPAHLRAKFQKFLDSRGNESNTSQNTASNTRASKPRKPDYIWDSKRKLMLPASQAEEEQSAQSLGSSIPAEVVNDIATTGKSLATAMRQHKDRKTAEEQFLIQEQMAPSKGEVEAEAMAYLAGVRGHFEQAYWMVEDDYQKAEDAPDVAENIRRRYMLEKVMEYFQNDPEYINDESVSSIWESIWKNKKKQTALV